MTSKKDEGRLQPVTQSSAEAAGLAVTISAVLGVPVPPYLVENVMRATSAIFTGLVDIPLAKLEGISAEIRAENDARVKIIEAAGTSASELVSRDPALAQRALENLKIRILKEQRNRESVMKLAAAELSASTAPTADQVPPPPIEEDWLAMFARHAETKSNPDVQQYFARILAGEIRKPGTFSPSSIEVLARLTADDAALFQLLCGLVTTLQLRVNGVIHRFRPVVLVAPWGSPGSNSLKNLGLSFPMLCRLQDAGLIQGDLNAWTEHPREAFLGMHIAGRDFGTGLTDPAGSPGMLLRSGTINLTRAGVELSLVVPASPSEEYAKGILEWLQRQGFQSVSS